MSILRFVFGNWALKGGALLLAIILYIGMVALQSTQVWDGPVPIEVVHQPDQSYLLRPDPLPGVTNVRYIASADVSVSSNSFRASIDLSNAVVSATETSLVNVQLTALDPRIQIIGFEPQQIRVSLDPEASKMVPVEVETGVLPSGLSKGPQTLTPNQVLATGPESLVARVSVAQATVSIDSSGMDVNKNVSLVAVDGSGRTVESVMLAPSSVQVSIQIGSQLRTESVAVFPVFTKDQPAAGYYISSIDINPPVVSVSGNANSLASLNGRVNTQPISIAGATGDLTFKQSLDLPAGVEASDVSTIEVTVHVTSPADSRSVQVGVVPQGANPDRLYNLSTLTVTVTISGARAALDAFDTSTLLGIVSVAGLNPGTYTLPVTVSVPPGIKVAAINPAQVIVTVSIPPSPPPSPSASPSPSPS